MGVKNKEKEKESMHIVAASPVFIFLFPFSFGPRPKRTASALKDIPPFLSASYFKPIFHKDKMEPFKMAVKK